MAGKALEGGRKKSVDRTGYFFVAPFVIVFFIFNVYPVVRTFYLSFTDYKGFDPEVSGMAYPSMKQAVLGINVSF